MEQKLNTVYIHMQSQSHPIVRENVTNSYTKDGLFCLYLTNGKVEKYPLCNIFKIVEEY